MEARNAAAEVEVEVEMTGAGEEDDMQDPANAAAAQKLVHIACTAEEVQQHFESRGTVNRVTIRNGYAYVEFLEVEAVEEALKLNESELHGRQLKVSPKRTNFPGMRRPPHPRNYNPYMANQFRGPYLPPPYLYSPYGGYGRVPRYRRPMRYRPYN